jgi:hypothetical protein
MREKLLHSVREAGVSHGAIRLNRIDNRITKAIGNPDESSGKTVERERNKEKERKKERERDFKKKKKKKKMALLNHFLFFLCTYLYFSSSPISTCSLSFSVTVSIGPLH